MARDARLRRVAAADERAVIVLLFTSSSGVVSGMIRWFTGGKMSHVGVQFEPNCVLSAEGKGVVEQPFDAFLKGRRLMASYCATAEGEKYLDIQVARLHVGNKYASNEIPGLAWVEVCRRWFGRTIRNPVHDPDRDVCSELALVLDQQGLVPEFEGLGVEFGGSKREATSPMALLERLRKGGPTFTKEFDYA